MNTHILVVDDSPSLREIVKRFLSKIPNIQVSEASDGAEAEQLLQQNQILETPVNIILLDWMMPNQNGHALLEKIRSIPTFEKHPKIIMLSAETLPEQIEACIKFDIVAYVTKPFTEEQIHDAVAKAMAA